jgi:chorismate lyase / 3-hydroxybenzoate synthase
MSEPRLEPSSRARRRSEDAGPAHLSIGLCPPATPQGPPAGRYALVTIAYGEHGAELPGGGAAGPVASGPLASGPGLHLRARLPQLALEPQHEVWSTAEEPVFGEQDGVRFARTSELLFGALELPGAEPDPETYDAYRRVLALVAGQGAHLLRTWNVVACFYPGGTDLDRYKQFCRGRARAFEAHHGAGFERRLCASTAVGAQVGPELVYFLAARAPGEHRENARQISAYRYPARYGPRSPSFARATRAPSALARQLLVSGTASIVGHESLHPEDAAAQTAETLRNMRVLVTGSADAPLLGRMSLVKVYLRDAADHGTVRRLVQTELGDQAPVLYLRADICRPELLVEIEGVALSQDG